MKVTELELPGVLLFEPAVHRDARGGFMETWRQSRYRDAGIRDAFVQDNVSRSLRGVLRGLHLQHPAGQGKLVTALVGEVFDVTVDVRAGSPTFGRWIARTLSEENARQLYIPPGFAHGFAVTSGVAVVMYKCTELYHRDAELCVLWNDPDLAIPWPVAEPLLSGRDRDGLRLRDIPVDRLPSMADGG